jgi:hypothetical protein
MNCCTYTNETLYSVKDRGHNYYFLGGIFRIWRKIEFQTSEVDAKLAPVNVGPLNFVC